MMKKNTFNSDAFAAIHASAKALHKVGAIDKATMRDFDETCLTVTPKFTPRYPTTA
jgi:putative transcriptional regulator